MANTFHTSRKFQKLASLVQGRMTAQKYGILRKKITKNGFSEIALYQAVVNHLDDFGISADNYAKDMFKLILGCAGSAFYIKTQDEFHYLSTQWHALKNGDLERGEPKSWEQKGFFLCNKCHEVKSGKEKSRNKNTKHTCITCERENAKISNEAARKRRKEEEERKVIDQFLPDDLAGLDDSLLDTEVNGNLGTPDPERQLVDELVAAAPAPRRLAKALEVATPEEVTSQPGLAFEPAPIQTMEVKPMPVENQPAKVVRIPEPPAYRIVSVMADENEAEITLKCDTQKMAQVMALLSQ